MSEILCLTQAVAVLEALMCHNDPIDYWDNGVQRWIIEVDVTEMHENWIAGDPPASQVRIRAFMRPAGRTHNRRDVWCETTLLRLVKDRLDYFGLRR